MSVTPVEVFKNLRPEELVKAQKWLGRLRADEATEVQQTLAVLNDFVYCPMGNSRVPLAFMVAGSSLGPDNYRDVDLFVVPRIPLNGDPSTNNSYFNRVLECLLPNAELEEKGYGGRKILKIDVGGRIMATISLLDRLQRFDRPRIGNPDDFIEPRGQRLGAERLFEYNIQRGNKFAVLSRQYPIK